MSKTWDLFNPIPKFNYNIMIKNIEVESLENPYVQVIWDDYAENFTQEKIKSVRHYFQKKYATNNVNVITKTKVSDDVDIGNVDISFNILDENYQTGLIKNFLKTKYDESLTDKIFELNSIVDNQLSATNNDVTPFKRWYIKNIEFSNFLSYGENQKLDFDKCSGINVVESNPPNFGGKTVLTVDLLLFLFFNETTKTNKAEEVFNRFTNKDKVYVKGEIIIDGDEYVIIRNIERKKTKSGDWNVKTELDFFKKLSDGSLQNFTGEQRRETESFIKNSIGSKEDFLMTILTTATNLEELIDSKPTARGQVLSRFMGLDFLKRKEDAAKEIYSQFSKSMLSNVYNSEKLKSDNENHEIKIGELNIDIDNSKKSLSEILNKIKIGQEYRDNLLKNKHIIDNEISLISPNKVQEEINAFVNEKNKVEKQLQDVKVIEPSSYYHEDEHDLVKEEVDKVYKDLIRIDTQISDINTLKSSVEGGIKCEHCGIELMNAEITNSKIAELAGLIMHKTQKDELMNGLTSKEQGFVLLKKEFDEYEKNKLIKEKYEVSIESFNLKIESLKLKLDRYNEVQDKILENNKSDGLIIKAGLRLDELDREKTQTLRNIDNFEYQIKTLTTKIKENKETILKIEEESEKEKIFKIFLEIFGKNGISKMIMRTMMPLINSELQRLLEDSSHFRLEIRINDKNEVEFIMIDNNTQIEKLMSSGSGYERTIASLALRAVLSKICSLPKPNIVVFDEVFGKISNDNLDMVSEFFTKIKEYFEKIFVITHNPLVNNWADNIIRIKKEENISFVYQ
jgi:DNA repair exonuclease SbcCD ATPase subunit